MTHILSLMINQTVWRDTCGYCLAIARVAIPSSRNLRISRTSSAVNLARPWASPLGCFARLFVSMSWTLSACVPLNRWWGFTQKPLSQTWQMQESPGSSPQNKYQAARWASHTLPISPTLPYRLPPPSAPAHIQQLVCGSMDTLRINFARAVSMVYRPYLPHFICIL